MVQFTDDMKLGIHHIDLQHESLVDFVNRAAALSGRDPSKEEMRACLDFLGNYVVKHFSDEEELQVESYYPRYRQHREIHQEFVRTFESLCKEFEKNGPTEDLSIALTKRVSNWIITHIKMEDLRFGEHYRIFREEALNGGAVAK